MKHCNNPQCPDFLRWHRMSEFEDEITHCTECRQPLADGEAPTLKISSPLHRPWLAFFVTLGSVIAGYLATLWVVPGLQERAKTILGQGSHVSQFSVVAFGLAPILTGFWLTEVLALFIPNWRRWRIEGQSGRRKLYWIALGIGLVVLLFQVFSSLAFFQHHKLLQTPTTQGSAFKTHLYVFVGFSLGSLGLVGLAEMIRKWGLGNGFSVLIASALIPDLLRQGYQWQEAWTTGLGSPVYLLASLLLVVLVTSLLWKLFRSQTSTVPRPSKTSTAAQTGDTTQRPKALTLPICGMVPYQDAAILLMLPTTLASLGWISMNRIYGLTPESVGYVIAASVLYVVLGVAYSLLFYRVDYVMPWLPDSFKTEDSASTQALFRQHRRKIMWMSILFLLLLFHGYSYIQRTFAWSIGLYAWVVGVAVVLDLWDEWKARSWYGDLVSVRPVHRLYTLHLAVSALNEAGISVHVRSLYHRSLLQFFGPFVPVELMVPRSQAETAQALLNQLYATRDANRLS